MPHRISMANKNDKKVLMASEALAKSQEDCMKL